MTNDSWAQITIPSGWVLTRLDSLCEVVRGGSPRPMGDPRFFGGSIPFIKIADVTRSDGVTVFDSETKVTPEGATRSRKIEAGRLILTNSATVCVPIFLGVDACIHDGFVAFENLPGFVNQKFLYYFFKYIRPFVLNQHKQGVTQVNLNTTIVGEMSFLLPPEIEQVKIVAKIEELFSELDKGIENLKMAQAQVAAYRQATLKHAFEGKLTVDWRDRNRRKSDCHREILERIQLESERRYQCQLRDWQAALQSWSKRGELGKRPSKPTKPVEFSSITNEEVTKLPALPESWMYVRLGVLAHIGSGMSVSKGRRLTDPVEIPYLRVANVQRGRLDLSQITSMRIEKSQVSQLVLKKWDVLFNEGGDRDKLGRGWIWEGQIDPCITQNHVFRASPYVHSESHSKFISHWGNTFGQTYFNTEGKQTTNLASINKTVLANFPVPLAPFDEQAEILKTLDSRFSLAEALRREIDDALEKLAALRQAILKRAFSGRLVQQDPNEEPASVLLERIRSEKEGPAMSGKSKSNNNKKEAA